MRLALVAGSLVGILVASAGTASAASITLTGVVRDFSARPTDPSGVLQHPDMENPLFVVVSNPPLVLRPYGGGGLKTGMVESAIGPDGKPVFNNGGCSPTYPTECSIESAASFASWYNDDPNYNRSALHSITLNEISPGLYQYSSNAFFPIDGQLIGNQGFSDALQPLNPPTIAEHNYHFTYELNTSFNYQSGQTFAFSGDDDLWVFINGQRVIDLGGTHGALPGSVSLDTLGLSVGQNYDLSLFFAERRTVASNFTITTSIANLESDLTPVPEPGSLVLLGTGLAGAIAWRRSRRTSSAREHGRCTCGSDGGAAIA